MLSWAREQARPPLDYPPLNRLIQGNLEIIKRIAVKKLEKESLKHELGEGRQYLSWCLALWEFSMHWEPLLLHPSICYHLFPYLHAHSHTSLKDPTHAGWVFKIRIEGRVRNIHSVVFPGSSLSDIPEQTSLLFHAPIFPTWIFCSISGIFPMKMWLSKLTQSEHLYQETLHRALEGTWTSFQAVGKEPAEHWRDSFDDIVYHFTEDDSCFSP